MLGTDTSTSRTGTSIPRENGVPAGRGTVLLSGLVGLGGAAALALAGSGRVELLLADDGSTVEPRDLDRSPLLRESDVGRNRAEAARDELARFAAGAPAVLVDARGALPSSAVQRAAVVIGTSESPSDLLLAHDAALACGRPFVYAGLVRFSAQLAVVVPGETPCLRCLFEEGPPSGAAPRIAEVGALGALASFAGGLAASEALCLLRGEVPAWRGRLVVYEARTAFTRAVALHRRPDCSTCGPTAAVAGLP